jgi:hypothetical protein
MNVSQNALPQDPKGAAPTVLDAHLAPYRFPVGHSRRTNPRATFRLLTSRGFAPREAGNLTAYLAGLRPMEPSWTIAEVSRLLFVRHLVERGWLHS